MLGVLAMKRRWKNKRRAEGKSTENPNLIMSSAVQVCWEKATRYFEIDEKLVYCTEDRYVIDPKQVVDLVDENTIGICAILGTTYTGEYEDVKGINDLLEERGLDTPIHVDAASGGFVAPFTVPDLEWDFRLSKVVSIVSMSYSAQPSKHIGLSLRYLRLTLHNRRTSAVTNVSATSKLHVNGLVNRRGSRGLFSPFFSDENCLRHSHWILTISRWSDVRRSRMGGLACRRVSPKGTRLQHQLPWC